MMFLKAWAMMFFEYCKLIFVILFLKTLILTETYDPDGNVHEPWSLGVKRSGSDTMAFSMTLAIALSIPKKIFS